MNDPNFPFIIIQKFQEFVGKKRRLVAVRGLALTLAVIRESGYPPEPGEAQGVDRRGEAGNRHDHVQQPVRRGARSGGQS